MSNAAFTRSFSAAMRKCQEKQELLCRVVLIELTASMVEKSPVDTGRFKNNWFGNIGSVDTTTTTDTDSSGEGSIGRVGRVAADFRPGQKMYITNSLPYAKPLEHGHSGQAPQGMVKLTIQEYTGKLRELLRGMK